MLFTYNAYLLTLFLSSPLSVVPSSISDVPLCSSIVSSSLSTELSLSCTLVSASSDSVLLLFRILFESLFKADFEWGWSRKCWVKNNIDSWNGTKNSSNVS